MVIISWHLMNATRARHLEKALNLFDATKASKEQTLPLDLFLRRYFQAHRFLKPPDRAWISEHTYELIKWRGLLDHIAPPPPIWTNRMKTFFLSDRWRSQTSNRKLPAHVRCSFPQDLFERIEASLGTKDSIRICNILNEPATTFLRVNTNKVARDTVYKYLTSKSLEVEKTLNSTIGLQLTSKEQLLEVPEYKLGYIEIQDESSHLIAKQVESKPGEKVLDYCAGIEHFTLGWLRPCSVGNLQK